MLLLCHCNVIVMLLIVMLLFCYCNVINMRTVSLGEILMLRYEYATFGVNMLRLIVRVMLKLTTVLMLILMLSSSNANEPYYYCPCVYQMAVFVLF